MRSIKICVSILLYELHIQKYVFESPIPKTFVMSLRTVSVFI